MTKIVKTLDTNLHGSLQSMICQQVTLSGDAEWPKVADAVIEAERLSWPNVRCPCQRPSSKAVDRADWPTRSKRCSSTAKGSFIRAWQYAEALKRMPDK